MRAVVVEATPGADGCAHPKSFSMTLRLSGWAAGRATATSGRDAWRSGVVDCVGAPNPGGRAGGKGKLSVSPISGTSRPGGSGRLPTGGIAGEDGGKASRRGSGNGAKGGVEPFRGSPPAATGPQARPTSVGRADWRQWRCRRRASRWRASRSAQRPQGENRFRKCGTLPVQSPDANRPSEGQSGPEGNNFRQNPLRTIPALERKVVECSF